MYLLCFVLFCFVSFMHIYSYLFCLYWCKDYCHRVKTQLQYYYYYYYYYYYCFSRQVWINGPRVVGWVLI